MVYCICDFQITFILHAWITLFYLNEAWNVGDTISFLNQLVYFVPAYEYTALRYHKGRYIVSEFIEIKSST